MKFKLIKLILAITILYGLFYLFSILLDCQNENEFNVAAKKHGLRCSRIKFIRTRMGRSSDAYFTYYKNGVLDTAVWINSCSDYHKLYFDFKQKLWFGFYTETIDFIVPVQTRAQFERLKKYFPDSAAIMDTTYLY